MIDQNGYDDIPCPSCHGRHAVHSGSLHACNACGYRWVDIPPPELLDEIHFAPAAQTGLIRTRIAE